MTNAPGNFESIRTDLSRWEIGPYHGALPGPMVMRLKLDGELIVAAEVETGFLHRGLEKSFELHSWQSSIAYADHLDPEGAAFGELALCLAVEEIASLEVPPRANRIRIILSELARISCHMGYMVKVARAVGAETVEHYILRDRERVLDLFELLTGARFSLNFLRFGGVRADVTEGFIERVNEVCDLVRVRIKEYNDLFTFNHSFLRRTASVGIVAPDAVKRLGLTGPNARASGLGADVRKNSPYSGYDSIEFEVPRSRGDQKPPGDAHDRFLMRLRELGQSVEILRQASDSLPEGEFTNGRATSSELSVPAGEAYARVESARGLLGCHVVSDGKTSPSRVQFRPPSLSLLAVLPEVASGVRTEDLPVVLASLDLGIAEADR